MISFVQSLSEQARFWMRLFLIIQKEKQAVYLTRSLLIWSNHLRLMKKRGGKQVKKKALLMQWSLSPLWRTPFKTSHIYHINFSKLSVKFYFSIAISWLSAFSLCRIAVLFSDGGRSSRRHLSSRYYVVPYLTILEWITKSSFFVDIC